MGIKAKADFPDRGRDVTNYEGMLRRSEQGRNDKVGRLLAGLDKITIPGADGRKYDVIGRAAGLNEVVTNFDPWTPYEVSKGVVAIRTGTVNGTVIPLNANQEFTVPGGLTDYYLEIALTGLNVSSVSYATAVSGSVPANPAPGETFPDAVRVLLFTLQSTAGSINWSTYAQYRSQSLSIASYVAEITGSAPEYTVKYGIVIL